MTFVTRLLGIGLILTSAANAVVFDFKDLGMRNQAILKTNGSLQSITFLNPTASGFLEVNPQALKGNFKGEIKLDSRFFDSGNLVRNAELKEKWLKASEGPEVLLRIDELVRATDYKLNPGKEIAFRANIQWSWLDKKKVVPVEGKLLYLPQSKTTMERLPGNLVRLTINTKWDRSDFFVDPIQLPRAMYAPEASLTLELLGTDQPPYQKLSVEVEKPKQR